jgi:Fur family ferric uptake transcriptional regulator
MSQDAQWAIDAIAKAGYRITQPRRVIVKALVASGAHITADDLAELVNESAPDIGRMTVYRTLDLLSELGLVQAIYQGTGAAHYVLMEGGGHHHLICSRCHRVVDFDDCLGDELVQAISKRYGFSAQSHLFEIHGVCSECTSS